MARGDRVAIADGIGVSAGRVRRARLAVSAGFLIFGMTFAIWAVHIPIIAARLSLDPAILGLALLNIGLGGVISQPLTGWLVGRIGSARATTLFLPLCLAAVCVPVIAWSTPVLFVGTMLLGLAGGAANVAINTQASEIEALRGKPTMSAFHGFFSLGALVGAVIGAGIIAAGLGDGRGAIGLAIVLVFVSLAATRYLIPSPPPKATTAEGTSQRFELPSASVLFLAVLVFASNMVEGSVTDWSALYLASVRGLSDANAASGFALFQLAMAVCRLGGGPVVAKLGEKNIVLFGGVLMALGMGVVVLSPFAFVSPFGFALVAIGAANTIPVMMGAASRLPGVTPGAGVAATATGALLGFLIGPPIIGFVAQLFGLGVSLGLLSLVGVIIAIGAALHRWPPVGAAAR